MSLIFGGLARGARHSSAATFAKTIFGGEKSAPQSRSQTRKELLPGAVKNNRDSDYSLRSAAISANWADGGLQFFPL